MKFSRLASILLLTGSAFALQACGGSAEEGRSEPVDMSIFKQGSTQFDVTSSVGEPSGITQHDGRECDIYHLYTSGLSAGGKAGMKAAEILTSIATAGVAQIIWAPVNAGTRPNIHTVMFCYDPPSKKLVTIYDKNPTNSAKPTMTIIDKNLYMQPVTTQSSLTPGVIIGTRGSTSAPTVGGMPPAPTVIPETPAQTTPATTEQTTTTTTEAPTSENVPASIPYPVERIEHDEAHNKIIYYPKQATAAAAPPAGAINLNTMSREAVAGSNRVEQGAATIPANATADDLNNIAEQRAATANAPALGSEASHPTTLNGQPIPTTSADTTSETTTQQQGSPDHLLHLPTK